MPRLAPAEPHGLDPIRRLTFGTARRMYGRELEPTRVIAHHRPLLAGLGALSLADERFSHSVPDHLKHLARLRAAQVIGCSWCLDFGSYLAQRAGASETQLRELATWRDSPHFDAVERLVLEYTEAMTRTPVEVSDELFARLRERFDERQIVELTMTVALENLYSRFSWSLGIEGEGFSEGMYCVRPEGDREATLA
ncbi:MAG TPA: carboxymuconolactone decarboxylase family protein [Solirubrobacteraceae bacterium]|nr:carboxymuconolactone decarboxylase family protein [Solirubrobacteraceae bacterium]